MKIKRIIFEKENLIVFFDDFKTINDIKEYKLVWISRNDKTVVTIEEEIQVNEENAIKTGIYKNMRSISESENSIFDLGIQSKITNELYKLNMNEEFCFIEEKKMINSIVDLNNNVYGFIYYNAKKQISLKLTETPEEAIKKYKKDSYTINSEANKKVDVVKDKKFNLIKTKLRGTELRFIFDEIEDINKSKSIKLVFKSRINKEKYTLNLNKKNIYNNKIIIDLSKFSSQYAQLKDRWDIFIECRDDKTILYGRVGLYNENFDTKLSSHLNYVETDCTNVIVPYITAKKEVALLVDTYGRYTSEKFRNFVEITDIDVKNRELIVKGSLEFREDVDFTLKNSVMTLRNNPNKVMEHELNTISDYVGKNKVKYVIKMNIDQYEYEQFYWDIFLVAQIKGEDVRIRVRNPKYKVKHKINSKLMKFNISVNEIYMLYPYITVNNCLSMTYRQIGKYETKKYKIRETIAKNIYKLFKPYWEKKEIWLIYEKFSETAQDNSFYFFKHCYENHSDKNIYYVITKDSQDYKNVEKYKDKVIEFMSIKHLIYLCACKLLVASESKGHSYAWRVQNGYIKNKLNEKKIAFLQHGVIALKKIDGIFKKSSANGVDLFVASSEYEKNIIMDQFGYDSAEVIVTGLARWDVLEDKSKTLEQKEIFFMPTWRNWLDEVPEEEFEKSPYFMNYMKILNSKKFNNMLKKNNLIVNYFVHPKFKYYIDKFSTASENIRIIQPGEMQVNELLMRASLLITDYSSVSWEMYYQNKPTLFYHFDIDDYNEYQGSYLDMETELFGDRAMNESELISKIQEFIDADFNQLSKYGEMRKQYFSYIDNKNCERTYKLICKNKNKLYKTLSTRQQILKGLRSNVTFKKVWKNIKEIPVAGDKIFKYKEVIFKKFKIEYKKKKKNNNNYKKVA